MNRRNFNRSVAVGAAAIAGTIQAAPSTPPNFVIIYCDDHVTESIQLGALVPNIDSMKRGGLFFPHAYAAAPACTPARYNALTGHYAGRCKGRFLQTGITKEGQTWVHWNADTSSDDWTGAKVLRDAGYATGIVGKIGCFNIPEAKESKRFMTMDAADPEKKSLFMEYERIMAEGVKPFGFDYGGALTTSNMAGNDMRHAPEYQVKCCLDFIRSNRSGPFYLHFAPHLTHAPDPLKSLKGDRDNVYGVLLDDVPVVQPSRKSVLERVHQAGLDEELAPTTWLDDSIGALFHGLEKAGVADNTLVIFMQDNGHHGGKGSCYEGGADVLGCWMRWSGGIKDPGRTNSTPVMNIDIVPTLFAAAGIEPPAGYKPDGISLLPALQGQSRKLRDTVLIEMGHTRAVIKDNWKYLAFRVPESHQLSPELKAKYKDLAAIDPTMDPEARVTHIHRQLGGCNTERNEALWTKPGFFDADQIYNLAKDPDEQNNLAAQPEYRAKLEAMQRLMAKAMMQAPGTFAEFKDFDDMPSDECSFFKKAGSQTKWTEPPINTKALAKAKRLAEKKGR